MKFIKAKILEIKKETGDVKTFKFELAKKIRYKPGQYCFVRLLGSDEERPFTFAQPLNKNLVELTIKKVGEFTGKMFKLKKGANILVSKPQKAGLRLGKYRDTIFIAGGSGIVPFICSLRYAIMKKWKNNLTLLFSVRTEKDIIYRKELEEMGKKPNIKIIITLSDKWSKKWKGERGLINKEMLKKYIKHFRKPIFYICGPPAMCEAMHSLLLELGAYHKNIKLETWHLPGKGDLKKR